MNSQRFERIMCALVVVVWGASLMLVFDIDPAARALDLGLVASEEAESDADAALAAGGPPRAGVIAVAAPEDARAVELRFPFEYEVALRFDPAHGHWHGQLDLPADLPDGRYQVSVKTTLENGDPLWQYADYVVGEVASDFELAVDDVVVAGEALDLLVDPMAPLSDVTVHFDGLAARPISLQRDQGTGLYHLEVPVPRDFDGRDFHIRVVATDAAKGKSEQTRTIEVIPAIECCHEEPGEDC